MFSSSPDVDPTLRISPYLGPHHVRYLQTVWLSNPGHFPTVESRQRWAAAHDLLPVAVHNWYRLKRQAMQRAKQKIPREEFELALPEPRLQPTLEELQEMRKPRPKPRPKPKEKVNAKKQERYSTAPISDGERRITRAIEQKLRAQSLDSEMLFSDADGASSVHSPLSSPVSEYSTLSLDHIYSGHSDNSATEYDGLSECGMDEDMPISACESSAEVGKGGNKVCCDTCEFMLSSGLVSDAIPDAPSNIWDAPYDFAFWAHFEARAYSQAHLKSMRDSYEQSGLASWENKGRVYSDFAWRWDMEEGDVAVKKEHEDEEMKHENVGSEI